jgi:hypothetical protein
MLTVADVTDELLHTTSQKFAAKGDRTMARYFERVIGHNWPGHRARCADILNAAGTGTIHDTSP